MGLETVVTCPYDKAHRIPQSSLPYHLVRCKPNHPLIKKTQCPFNACHILDPDCLEDHTENCPDSINVKRYQYSFEGERQLGTVPIEAVKDLTVPIMKDWDEEPVETYDPLKSTEDRNIIRYLTIGTKAQRREFRLAERKRIALLQGRKEDKCRNVCKSSRRIGRKVISVSKLADTMRRLYIKDFSMILESLDMNKLLISENSRYSHTKSYFSEVVKNVLAKKFEALILAENFRQEKQGYDDTKNYIKYFSF